MHAAPPPHASQLSRTAGLGGGGATAAGAAAGWSEQKKPWRQRPQLARPGASAATADAIGSAMGVGAGPRALGLAAGLGGFSCV
jgi:hypothetical protein